LFFSGLASSTTVIDGNPNFGLLAVAMSLIFFGSWTNEILLDIRDTEGDKVNNIQTIPILFGKETSFKISSAILNYCIITNSLALLYLYNNIQVVLAIPIIFSSLLVNLQKIKKNNFSNESIVNYMKYSNYKYVKKEYFRQYYQM
jgi:4-hydroxybenzoate polyprenyltransferase